MSPRVRIVAVSVVATTIAALLMVLAMIDRASAENRIRLCAPLADLLEGFKAAHKETPAWIGTTMGGNRLILVASVDGSWTLIEVAAGGEPACAIAGGKSSRSLLGREI